MKYIVEIIIIIIIILLYVIYSYAYYSGSCKINKDYKYCNDHFCLFKKFKFQLNKKLLNEIDNMTNNKSIQSRVNINSYFENISNCALPNRKGITIPTLEILKYSPDLINYYQNDLCKIVSDIVGIKLYTTELNMPTSCAIIIYNQENDWINWHYDYNYYDGRFFTVLIPITQDNTCTTFQYMNNDGKIFNINLSDALCFEGNYLYHRATKLCEGEKRIVLSCQYVTTNNMTYINKLRIKLKDYAFIGKFL